MGKKVIKKKRVESDEKKVLLDLGCGDNKCEGYLGVDQFRTPSVDIVHNLFDFPWPFADSSVDGVHCSHFFEHVPGLLRGKFMDEVWRILKYGSKCRIIVPYWTSKRAVQDFTHVWPPICEESFMYFNKGFRDANKLTHGYYALQCDFDFSWGYVVDQALTVRSEEYRNHALLHNVNVVNDLDVTLIKTKREEVKG